MRVRPMVCAAVLVMACLPVSGCAAGAEGDGPAGEGAVVMAERGKLAEEPLICLWCHRDNVDMGPIVEEVGFNTIWTHDPPYEGQQWESTMMYRALEIPGVEYVVAKIDRIQWGWTHEGSVAHAKWVGELSLAHPEIIGLYLNDFYDEIEDGYRTMEQWREIIAAGTEANPKLTIWVPHYPHRANEERPYDFRHDAVVFNLWDHRGIPQVEEHLARAEAHHPDTPVIAGLYLNSGSGGGHWLTEEEFKGMLRIYVEHVNAGKLAGLRVFCACQMARRPEYVEWAKEVLGELRRAPTE